MSFLRNKAPNNLAALLLSVSLFSTNAFAKDNVLHCTATTNGPIPKNATKNVDYIFKLDFSSYAVRSILVYNSESYTWKNQHYAACGAHDEETHENVVCEETVTAFVYAISAHWLDVHGKRESDRYRWVINRLDGSFKITNSGLENGETYDATWTGECVPVAEPTPPKTKF